MERAGRGYTINGARQLHWQDRMGSLEAGKAANLVIADRDIFDTDVSKIKDIGVDAVVFEGKVISTPERQGINGSKTVYSRAEG